MWDCHCHLGDASWTDLPARLAAARSRGIRGWLSCGYDVASWSRQRELSRQEGILIAQGLHPWALPDSDSELEQQLGELHRVLDEGEAVALGECGIDYYRARPGELRERQWLALRRQLQIASERNLSVVLHCVRAHHDLQQEMERWPGLRFMVHGFLGKWEEAERWLQLGAYLSLGPHAVSRTDLMKRLPVDRILVETDAPSRGIGLEDLISVVEAWKRCQPLSEERFETNLRAFLGRTQGIWRL